MPRLKPQPVPQAPITPHAPSWQELGLLVAYLVVCVLAFLTVLLPATENKELQDPPLNAPNPPDAPNTQPAGG